MTQFVDLDVRPILRAGGEPFQVIMNALAELSPEQGLRLFTTFRPSPLFHVLQSKGYGHDEKALDNGEWEVRFFRKGSAPDAAPDVWDLSDETPWPAPTMFLDLRDLPPPEPMERILGAIEGFLPGMVLSALLHREPVFLLPELARRGHDWRGQQEDAGAAYRLLVRAGGNIA